MALFAETLFCTLPVGATCVLPRAGTALENAYVYDAVARDLQVGARRGDLEITAQQVEEVGGEPLIRHLEFRRLR
ncbi:hypothetical protein [Rubrivivax rivuli]|uniref:Uncharacterized protein n=1 Tax=Rubrivivax rivuli TaxID=1862385 RepID=A0A437REE3_9BURK|nr:hypothetical protein [Rubrivivax rivuli]RVU45125.1 hypothetical protein EOE66_13290 [Rubrivivax rivuli]